MANSVPLPDLGEGVESGDVLDIFVSVGDSVSEGDDLIEVETDKATAAVPSPFTGTIASIAVSEGDTVTVGMEILTIDAAGGGEVPVEQAPAAPVEQAPAQPAPAPTPDPPAAPPVQPVSPPAPVVATPATVAPPAPVAAPATVATAAPVTPAGMVPAGPSVRKFAREVGVDLSTVQGSGPDGRITRDDVLGAIRSGAAAGNNVSSAPAANGAAAAAKAPVVSAKSDLPGTPASDDFGPVRVERMSKIRKTIGAQMHASWSTVPRVTNFDDADITDLETLRQSSKDDYKEQGLRLTTMPFLIKAVATALSHHPALNAVIDSENQQVIYKDYVNIGIAVDTDRGLVVPVMPNADRMSIPDITRGLGEMAGKVRGGQFGMSDLKGGTFTISNLGAIGGQYSTPIVNVPEVAILLVGRSRKLPVVMPDDSIQPRLMMPMSLSYDHRLVDGGAAARFLNEIIELLEAPSRLLLAL